MNIYKKIKVNWVIIGVLTLMLIACSSDDSDLVHYINTIKERPAKPIEPIPELQPPEKFIYPEEDNRRSPFKPVVDIQDTFAPNIKRPKQPLEHFPLDALKFVGILKEGKITWALISQPGGLISRVQVGDYMGQDYGQILTIKDKTIQLEESVQVNGKWEKRKIIIDLRSPEEDKNKRAGLAK